MKKLLLGLALGASTVVPSTTFAQDAEDPNTGALTFTGAVDFTHAYYFRGYLQENDGLIVQPSLTVSGALADNVTIYGGMWNSLHSEQTGGDEGIWYEADFFAGADIVLGPVVLGVNYTLYVYPDGGFEDIHELQGKLTFDDSTLSEDPAIVFKPYVLVAYELADDNGTEDTYLEVGANPSFGLGDTGLSITVPIALGMSLDDYYFDDDGDDELLGFATVGLATSIPLPVPSKYGAWNLNASIKYLYLIADGLEAANEDDEHEFIGTLGISFAY
jgi:uncharacterized protein (TIGR02001 family)